MINPNTIVNRVDTAIKSNGSNLHLLLQQIDHLVDQFGERAILSALAQCAAIAYVRLAGRPALSARPLQREAPAPAAALGELFEAAEAEAEKARQKFPQPNYVITKFAEEAGEVIKGAVHCAEGREKPEKVVAEIRQAIAMLIRLYLEGDQVHGLPPLAEAVKGGNAHG